jgi:hypothetical protein
LNQPLAFDHTVTVIGELALAAARRFVEYDHRLPRQLPFCTSDAWLSVPTVPID